MLDPAVITPATKSSTCSCDNCVLVSADAIVTAPPDSVIVTLLPAVNARVSLDPNVLPPAVTVLKVLVSETELVIVTAPPLSEIVIPVPAVKARVSPDPRVLPPAVTVLNVLVSVDANVIVSLLAFVVIVTFDPSATVSYKHLTLPTPPYV